MVSIKFVGAAGTVTGSCYIIEGPSGNVMVDCGMFQGPKELTSLNYEIRDYNPADIERLVLTHAHIDHSGLIPRFCMRGFTGRIFTHPATTDLAGIMLPDSGHIQEQDTEWANRKRVRRGQNALKPLYTKQQAINCLSQFSSIPYNEWTDIGGGFKTRLIDAGHILGSACVEIEILDKGERRRFVFSGDLGNKHPSILRDPSNSEGGEVVICETTYGGRVHEKADERRKLLEEIINQAIAEKGKIIIPAFAIGRTQEIIYLLNELRKEGAIPEIPVFIDSPLAISATEIFKRHPECYDQEMTDLLASGEDVLDFPGVRLTQTVDESRAINERAGSAIIISASGMCDAGRIKHHLLHNLYKPNTHVIFAGFQAVGTLGRQIRDGAKEVTIFGEKVAVKAHIHSVGAFSAHADREGLSEWLGAMTIKPATLFLTHGEESQTQAFAEYTTQRFGFKYYIPDRSEVVDIDHVPSVIKPPVLGVPPVKGLVDDLASLDMQTAEVSGRLARLSDLLHTGLIHLDGETMERLRGVSQTLDKEAKNLLGVLDDLHITDEE